MKKINTSQEESKEIFRRVYNSLNLKALPFIYANPTFLKARKPKKTKQVLTELIILLDLQNAYFQLFIG